jgi:L-ribulose-5-phosphate 4-epimerase
MEEGYIKFNCKWIKAGPISKDAILEINSWRETLYKLGLIGVYNDGIGFGNISIRFENSSFLITGSATGGIEKLNENHYVLVNEYNLQQNSLTCTGPIKASSESLSHAAIYENSPLTNAIIHVHHIGLWEKLIDKLPTTKMEALYGTPEIANEIERLFKESNVKVDKLIIMGGHKEGILSFGVDLAEAGRILLNELKLLKHT